MPLSSVVGAQSIIKPGVCTSSTRPASPYDGQVIYETDTDKTLVYNGTGWVFLSTSRANPVGLDLVKTQTVGTAVSSVTVSDAFSSSYDSYKIIATGVAATGNGNVIFQLSGLTTAYYGNLVYANWASGTPQSVGYSNIAYATHAAGVDLTALRAPIETTEFTLTAMGTVQPICSQCVYPLLELQQQVITILACRHLITLLRELGFLPAQPTEHKLCIWLQQTF